jgi:hypothetical protein
MLLVGILGSVDTSDFFRALLAICADLPQGRENSPARAFIEAMLLRATCSITVRVSQDDNRFAWR